MYHLFKQAKPFFILFLILLLAGLPLLLIVERGAVVLWVNHNHQPWADYLFYYITTLGNGWALGITALILLLYRYRLGFIATLAFGIQGVLIQLLKRFVFPEFDRPLKYFQYLSNVNLVEGVNVHSLYAFPSGHTGSAFCLFCFLALVVRKPAWQALFFFLALLAGISRIYLFQHFFMDVYFGSMIGVAVAILFYAWLERNPPGILRNKHWWYNRGLLN